MKTMREQIEGPCKPFVQIFLILQYLPSKQLNTGFSDCRQGAMLEFTVFFLKLPFEITNLSITQTIIYQSADQEIYTKIQLFFINSDMNAQIMELIQKKDGIEAQLTALAQQIKLIDDSSNFQKGLVDSEGFPRADIDFGKLSDYRNLKRKKAELNNDHSALMKQIQKKLFALHLQFPQIDPEQQEVQSSDTLEVKIKETEQVEKKAQKKEHQIDYLTPFAKISIVDKESPSSKGGLRIGDLLSQFAEVNIYSIDFMKQLPKYVKEGQQISLVIMRRVEAQTQNKKNIFKLKDGNLYQKIKITIVPSKWEGKGLLGCKIDPIH